MADPIILGANPKFPVRLSYVYVWEPKVDKDTKKETFTAMILIDKKDKTSLKVLEEAYEAAAEAAITKKWGGKRPKHVVFDNALKDGDEYDGEGDPEPLIGKWYINANARNRPGVVDKNVKPVIKQDLLYSGTLARVEVSVYGYSAEDGKKKDIAYGLENIQVLDGGDPLGAVKRSAESAFSKFKLDEDDELM